MGVAVDGDDGGPLIALRAPEEVERVGLALAGGEGELNRPAATPAVAFGVVRLTPAQLIAPALVVLLMAPALAALNKRPLMLAVPVVSDVKAAVDKLISLIVPFCPAATEIVPPTISKPFMPPVALLVVVTV